MSTAAQTGISRYRTKPVEIEAIQFVGDENCELVHAFIGAEHPNNGQCDLVYVRGSALGVAEPGDWIIRTAGGAFEVIDDKDFQAEFEAAGDD